MPYKDPQKQLEYQRQWQNAHRLPKSQQTGWNKRKEMVKSAKDKPCAICKVKYDPCVMDLHHLDPSIKDGMVSKIVKSGSYKTLQEEIDKCVALCSNCHRMLHNNLVDLILKE
jgi:hypothetical protein